MERVDLSEVAELDLLTGVLRESSRQTDPAKMMAALGPWFSRQGRYDMMISVSRRNLPEGEYKITRVIEDPKIVEEVAQRNNPWRDWSMIPTQAGGVIGRVIERDESQLFRGLQIDDDPVLGIAVREMRSLLALPNFDNGRALNWALFFRRDPEGWPLDEVPTILKDGNLLGMATKNLVAHRRADELNAKLTAQLERVASVQRALLPARTPDIPGLSIATSYLTSDEAGGDYYDFFAFPNGQWGILIADVSGHGAAAATVMAMLRAILHCFEGADLSPASVMRFANDKLVDSGIHGSFVTAFFGVYDPQSGQIAFSRCGHNPPRLARADGAIVEVDGAGSVPLGIVKDAPIEQETITLEPEATLVLYTDGITEAFSTGGVNGGREMFGLGRLDGAISACGCDPESIIDAVHAALLKHVGAMTRDDDQTLVVIRRTSGGRGPTP